jgi:putative inorganic carbon (hco3(-)) transporter
MLHALLLALVIASLAAFGGTYRWSTMPLLGGAGLFAATAFGAFGLPRLHRLLDLSLAGIALVIAMQLLPLPGAFVDALSPHAGRVTRLVQLSYPGGSDVRPLSLDRAATLHALGTFVTALLVFLGSRAMLAHGGTRGLVRGLAWIGGTVAVVALVQQAATPRLIFGFWDPRESGAYPLGPFVNRNHFAGWVLMCLPLAIGYYIAHIRIHLPDLSREPNKLRAVVWARSPVVLTAIVVMTLALVAAQSRSGFIGLAVAGLTVWRLARTRSAVPHAQLTFLLAVAAAVALVVLATINPEQMAARVAGTWQRTGTNRLVIWRETLPLVRDFWTAGVGAGAYGVAMLVYQNTRVPMAHLQLGGWAHFNQAHSHYLQVVAEGGVLLAVPAIAAIGALIGAIRRGFRSHAGESEWIRIGAVASLAAIAVQSIWETSLRMPANAILCGIVAAIAVHHRDRRSR